MNRRKGKWLKISLAATLAMVLVLSLVLPFSIARAGELPSYTLETFEPQTIPLWGPTWNHGDVTVIIKPGKGVSQEAIDMVEQSISDWNRAIHTRLAQDSPFHLVLITSGKADITIRPKKGGGMVQGQALCKSANGFFTDCKINVSGRAFGSDNPPDTVLGISIQELGHALGLLHSDNSEDVMYGTLQAPPNTVISQCDIDAWEAVMHWLLADGPNANAHPPHEGSVSCGDTTGGGDGTVTGDLDVGVAVDPPGPFVNRDRVHIFVTVKDGDGNSVEGAAVHIRIVTPNPITDRAGDFTTDADGVVHTHYKVNSGRDGTGTYHVHAESSKDQASGACLEADPCHADFEVN